MPDAGRPLDLADIQGNTVRPYHFHLAGYLVVAVEQPEEGRRWLGHLVDGVTTSAERPRRDRDHALNLGVSFAGLAALGVPDRLLATFPPAFREGMVSRAARLGDVGASDPAHWQEGLRGDGHVVVVVHAQEEQTVRGRVNEIRREVEADDDGVRILHDVRSVKLSGGREHFGFADGFAQPAVAGSGHPHQPGQGAPMPGGRWRPIEPGEFVLGYQDEDGVRPESPAPPLGDNGSYMVMRKLYQDVAGFRRFLAETAAALGWREDVVAAKLVGRWRDGSPLELSPEGPDPAMFDHKDRINDFRYGADLDGFRCPLGAHIRRTNPRDALGWDGKLSQRHRIIRRGMPYGKELPPGAPGDDVDRGLMFFCFNASIERQFETVQATWCVDGNSFGLGDDVDFIVARPYLASGAGGPYLASGAGGPDPASKMTVQGPTPAFLVQPEKPFVVTRGGEYLFAPGIRALRALAGADW